jgi:hypothetical protein
VVDVPSLTRPAPARPRAKHSVVGGLAVVLRLSDGAPDVSIAKETLTFGLAPTPLSLWYASRVSAQSGLPLGIATASQKRLVACDRLDAIIDRFTCRFQAPLAPDETRVIEPSIRPSVYTVRRTFPPIRPALHGSGSPR